MNYEEQIKDYLTDTYYVKMMDAIRARKKFPVKAIIAEVAKKHSLSSAEAIDNVWDWLESSFSEEHLEYFSS